MPDSGLEGIAILIGALGALSLFAALRRLLRVRLFAASRAAFTGVVLLAAALALLAVSANLRGYARLTHEAPVAEIGFEAMGPQLFRASLAREPDGASQSFALHGDDWQIDARVLKFRGVATLLGFEPMYQLERVSGRYRELEQERSAARSVLALAEPPALDLFALARAQPRWLPFVDALYGSAAYMPMADGARYRVTISASGLVARPMNPAAERAVGAWR